MLWVGDGSPAFDVYRVSPQAIDARIDLDAFGKLENLAVPGRCLVSTDLQAGLCATIGIPVLACVAVMLVSNTNV